MEDFTENAPNDPLFSPSSPTKQKAKTIQAIKKNDVHQICSGQVVLNLAIAVKELVENGLDAGATCIEVRLKEYGKEFIKVIDNGCGVEEDNFQGLTLKHHTSKLRDFSDLVSVATFGFRGEALSSLCAMGNLTVETRHVDATSGTRLMFDRDGKIVSRTTCPRQVGTSVCIANLFASLPVRQKEFHRNLKREFGKMTQLLYAYCLVATGVKITCVNALGKAGPTTVAATHGSRTVRENIGSVFGSKQAQALLELEQPAEQDSRFSIEGYVSSANHGQGRGAPDRQFYYVNARPCEPSKLMKMVNETYHTFNANQHPFVFLNVTVKRADVDVNVTPDKRQVFFDNEKQLLAAVKFQNTSLHLQISFPPATSPSLTAPKESKLASLLNEWKRQSSISPAQGVKRGIEEETDDNSPGKQPCILNFFKRQTPNANVRVNCSDLDDLPRDNCAVYGVPIHRSSSTADSEDRSPNKDKNNFVSLSESCAMATDYNYMDTSAKHETNARDQLRTISTIIPMDMFDTDTASDSADVDGGVKPEARTHDQLRIVHNTLAYDSTGVSEVEVIKDHESKSVPLNTSNPSCELDSVNAIQSPLIDNELHDSEGIILEQGSTTTNSSPSDSANEVVMNEVMVNKVVASEVTMHEEMREDSISVISETEEERPSDFKRCAVWLSFTLDSIVEQLERRKVKRDEVATVVRFRATIDPGKNKSAEQELGKEIKKHMFKEMSIIGQFNLGFIITRLGSDLFIIDQHASDEKYNFETLQLTQTLTNQRLVFPINLELCAVSENTLIENMHIFKTNGFDFAIDSAAETTKRVKLTAIPMSRNWQFGKEDVDELLFMLQDAPGTMCRPSRVRAMFASRACRKSVMIGTALSQSDMRRLVDNMGTIEQPWNCPHGRPTMRHLINLDLLHSAESTS